MLNETQLPKEIVEGTVRKVTLEGIDEIQSLYVAPMTTIKTHSHDENQWEVWVRISHKDAYACLKGKKHKLVEKSGNTQRILAIKGHGEHSLTDFVDFFYKFGIEVREGDLICED